MGRQTTPGPQPLGAETSHGKRSHPDGSTSHANEEADLTSAENRSILNDMKVTFREVIKKALDARGWSGYRLAKEADLPMRTVQAYLAGENEITSGRLAAICSALGLELREARKSR
jgi:ribosome-binding protein aMBF1 (putative translation factor)